MKKGKIILDLCGGTGSWSKPYKEAGYDVRVITWPEYDVGNYFANAKFLTFYSKSKNLIELDVRKVYEILAAPPCTMFSLARTTAKTPRDLAGAMEIVKSCLDIIWYCRSYGALKFWALENPMGYLRQFLGKPPLTFQPCDYGDPYTKKTDLWGYYNLPKKSPVKLTTDQVKACSINNRELPRLPEDYLLPGNTTRQAARRAMTPQGFAKAFFKANK